MSGVTSPETMASPSPKTASITVLEASFVTGLIVNITPDRSACTIRWTTTPMPTSV